MYIYHIDENPDGLKSTLAADLKWTTEPPTQEGWYWTPNGNSYIEVVEVRKSKRNDAGLVVYRCGEEVPLMRGYSYWLGPLPVPELPTDL